MSSHFNDIRPGAIWREKRTGREVTVLNRPAIYGNDFVHIQGQRKSFVRRNGFQSRYELVTPAPTTHRPGSGTPSAAGSDDERQGFVVTPEESSDE